MKVSIVVVSALALACLPGCSATPKSAAAREGQPVVLRVMTFNLWQGGDQGKQPLGQTAEVIRAAGADVAGLQETAGLAPQGRRRPDNAAKIAAMLGWHYVDQGEGTGIISRYPIVATTPKQRGVEIELPGGARVYVFNVHLMHAPYQPYQLLSIPYGDGVFIKTEREAIEQAKKARGAQVAELLGEIEGIRGDGLAVFVTGDFNEPSHLDWTKPAAAAEKCPIKVEWPSTKALADAGFIDALRKVRPDEVTDRANTWTPTTEPGDPKDRHDRIDLVMFGGSGVRVKEVKLVGEDRRFADVVVRPYPSDHRAVVAEFDLAGATISPHSGQRSGVARRS
jgi:endonuclease/exonuclease/phosphatase family metal-dependent hydrolase